MAIAPIWKDYTVQLTAASRAFRIELDYYGSGNVIYEGRSIARPGDAVASVRVNEVCWDWLKNTLPTLSLADFTALTFPLNFVIEEQDPDYGSWDPVASVEFYGDWSYDDGYDPVTMGMNAPITERLDPRQYVFATVINAPSITAVLTMADATQLTITRAISALPDFSNDFNNDFARSVRSAGSGTLALDLGQFPDVAAVDIGLNHWDIVRDCRHRYALAYTNAYGGWDTLLMEGQPHGSLGIDRKVSGEPYDNGTFDRGQRNRVNVLAPTLTLRTGLLTDEQSELMHHLVASTEVWLQDMERGTFLPVIVTDTALDIQSRRSNGGRLCRYDVNVQLAQERERR